MAIREVAADVLANKFYDMDYKEFDKALLDGKFDNLFKTNTKKKQGKEYLKKLILQIQIG